MGVACEMFGGVTIQVEILGESSACGELQRHWNTRIIFPSVTELHRGLGYAWTREFEIWG